MPEGNRPEPMEIFSSGRKTTLDSCQVGRYHEGMVDPVLQAAEMAGKTPSESRIAGLLQNLMQLYGWNQRELAAKWGVSEAMVSKILSGERQAITLDSAQRLIDAFGLDPRALFEVGKENGSK